MTKPCAKCKFRAAYDRNNSSFVGRLWRWHINICPGWRLYYNYLDEAERREIHEKYDFKR